MRRVPIKNFRPVSARSDSTEIGASLTKAQNFVLRPAGAFKCAPILRKLWGFGTTQTPFATFDALTHPSGSGTIGTADKTIAVRIYYQGRNILMFYNMWTGTHNGQAVVPGLRGLFYLGRDEGNSDEFDPLAAGPPLFEVLSYNLDPAARWYGDFSHGQLNCQNGVDDALAIQIGRTFTPGKLRKRGSNAVPAAPVISMIEPQLTTNTQAARTVTGRAGGVNLVFTANEDNYPGERGNSKIKVKITYGGAYSAGAVSATITGDGTPASPYLYEIFTSAASSSNNAIIAYVNNDSKAKPILTASGANATADTFDDTTAGNPSGVFLTGGAGTGLSEGLTSAYYDCYARYWDGGYKSLGYEAPSSLVSNDITIDATTFKDILIQVDVDETAEGGRFSHANAGIRIYLRNGVETDAVWNLMNEDAFLLNTHRTQRIIGTPASAPMWSRTSQLTATYVGRTNVLTVVGAVTNGTVAMVDSAVAGLSSGTRLYVVGATGSTSFGLSLTSGGSAIDIGDSYVANTDLTLDELSITGTVTNGQTFQVGGNTVGLPSSTTLYVINASTALGVTTFQASLTAGGSAINITSSSTVTIHMDGSGVVLHFGELASDRLWSVSDAVAALTATTSLAGDTLVLATTVTNGKVFVIEADAAGIPANTKLYAVNCEANTPTAGSTRFQLSLSLGGSPIDITSSTTVTIQMLATNQWSSSDIVIMPSGGGATAPSSLALDTRYYIKAIDADGYGMQISSSKIGDALAIGSAGSMNSFKVVAVSLVVGSTTEPGRGMSPDQNRPPPHRYVTMAGTFNWCAGFDSAPSKILSSKDQQFDELSPEGVDLSDEDYVRKARSTSAFRITGLWSDMRSLHIHCEDGIVIMNPDDTEDQQEPLIASGMVNGQSHSVSDNNQIVFLAFNRQIMAFNGARYGNRASKAKTDDAVSYINDYIDNQALTLRPDDCCVLHDKESSMFWFWMPSDTGTIGFVFDESMDGVVGPFTAPLDVAGACSLEAALAHHIVANRDGYLFSWDTIGQFDHGDVFDTEELDLHLTSESLPADHGGYAYNDITAYVNDAPVTRRLFYSQRSIMESGLIDMGDMSTLKRFVGLEWRSISGSRGYVKVTLIDHAGNERGVWYGELGLKYRNKPHAVRMNLVDTAVKIRVEVYSADLQPWCLRDMALLFE